MNEVNPGDQVWIPAVADHIAHTDKSALWVATGRGIESIVRRSADQWMRDHPALPAIARLLNEYPNALNAVFSWAVGDESGGELDRAAVSAFIRIRDEANRLAAAHATEEDGNGL